MVLCTMLKLNLDMLAHAYDYLNCQPPFASWNLPHSEDLRFFIKQKPLYAMCQPVNDTYHITFSPRLVGSHNTLISTMAHEMIHVHMDQTCGHAKNFHDRTFQRVADRVCKIHGFDRLIF